MQVRSEHAAIRGALEEEQQAMRRTAEAGKREIAEEKKKAMALVEEHGSNLSAATAIRQVSENQIGSNRCTR